MNFELPFENLDSSKLNPIYIISPFDIATTFSFRIRKHEKLRIKFSRLFFRVLFPYFDKNELEQIIDTIINGDDNDFKNTLNLIKNKVPFFTSYENVVFDNLFEYKLFEILLLQKDADFNNLIYEFLEHTFIYCFNSDKDLFRDRILRIIRNTSISKFNTEIDDDLPFKLELSESERNFISEEINIIISKKFSSLHSVKTIPKIKKPSRWKLVKSLEYTSINNNENVNNATTKYKIVQSFYKKIGKEIPTDISNSYPMKLLDKRIIPKTEKQIKDLKEILKDFSSKGFNTTIIERDLKELHKKG